MELPADPRMMMANTLLAHLVSVQYKSGISIGRAARWAGKGNGRRAYWKDEKAMENRRVHSRGGRSSRVP
jgi:hypothetical protein